MSPRLFIYEASKANGPLNITERRSFEDWLKIAAPQIAFAAVTVGAFLDPKMIVIDSSLAPELTQEVVAAVKDSIGHNYDKRSLAKINIEANEIRISARAIGSRIIPLLSELGLEKE